jgi:hypothetical protein
MYVLTSPVVNAVTTPFAKLWQGRYPLPVAFWLWFIVGWFAAPFIVVILSIPLYFAGIIPLYHPGMQPQEVNGAFITFYILANAYPLFAAVGVWRSANARPFRRWPVAAAAAKIVVCVALLALASRVTGLGLLDVLRFVFGERQT